MKNPLFYRRYIGTTSYANGCTAFIDISRRIPAECTRGLHFLRDPATVGSNQPGQQGPTQTHGTALPPTLSYLGGWIIILTGSNRKKKNRIAARFPFRGPRILVKRFFPALVFLSASCIAGSSSQPEYL